MFDFIFIFIGIVWSTYTYIKNLQQPKATREHWFTAIFFSFFLWWLLIPLAWPKGIIQRDFGPLITGLRITVDRIFGK
jgi:hypothetical protein